MSLVRRSTKEPPCNTNSDHTSHQPKKPTDTCQLHSAKDVQTCIGVAEIGQVNKHQNVWNRLHKYRATTTTSTRVRSNLPTTGHCDTSQHYISTTSSLLHAVTWGPNREEGASTGVTKVLWRHCTHNIMVTMLWLPHLQQELLTVI